MTAPYWSLISDTVASTRLAVFDVRRYLDWRLVPSV